MLRVTVSRESATESVSIGEVVIGKFAGTEQRGGYAARVYEPPSPYSEGIDACFTVRSHERYQPAMALVASVLAAWREGRVDQVGDGVRTALLNSAQSERPVNGDAKRLVDRQAALARIASGDGTLAESARATIEVLNNALALADSLIRGENL